MTQLRASRLRWRHVLLNVPLVIGAVVLLGLFIVVLFGPLFAPENPYLAGNRVIEYKNGQLMVPPFPPSPDIPLGTDQWGRDLLSILLYGARNTLVACTFITMARLILGLILGAAAGWNSGRLVDRIVMGAVELTTALPMLLIGMIIIFALDIRRGILVFIIALCFVGWGEIAQYIRSEFMTLKGQPFIEGARVIGLHGVGIAVRHVLPNVLPALVVLALLEMGAVLMILGELGFAGVFIGGGIRQESVFGQVTIPDIPEWGAMLASSRRYARSYIWMVAYPAMAFFVAVLGFNMMGEGLRRLVEQVGVSTAFILSRRMLVIIAVVVVATVYIINNVGPAPSYARLAGGFDGVAAIQHVAALTSEDLADRRVGAPGLETAAQYIASRFEMYGLQPAGQGHSYFQPMTTHIVYPEEQPGLAQMNAEGTILKSYRHRLDFGERITRHGGSGTAEAPLTFVGFEPGRRSWPNEVYIGMDLRGQIALYLAEDAPPSFDTEALIRGARGILVVADNVVPQVQLTGQLSNHLRKPTIPIFHITPAVADEILAGDDLSVAALRERLPEETREQPWFVQPLTARAHMHLVLSPVQEVTTYNVLGLVPGTDLALNDQLIVVGAHYDNLGREPDGTLYPGANDGASGVAAVLEIARLWSAEEFKPRRTVLFAAWTAGNLPNSGYQRYQDSYSPLALLRTVAVFNLDRLGHGDGRTLLVDDGANRPLTELLGRSAEKLGVGVQKGNPLLHNYQRSSAGPPSVVVSWADQDRPGILSDVSEQVDPQLLGTAGQIVNLALITASREPSY